VTIFDFIPQLKQMSFSSEMASPQRAPQNTASKAACNTEDDDHAQRISDFLAQQAREQQEWEQVCQRAWIEMKQAVRETPATSID